MAIKFQPDPAALEIAHRLLRTTLTLEQLLASPTFKPILENVARRHMQRRAQFDVKKLQCNDND